MNEGATRMSLWNPRRSHNEPDVQLAQWAHSYVWNLALFTGKLVPLAW